MTKDKIIRMVTDVGFSQEDDDIFVCGIKHIQKLLEIEREECAKICDAYGMPDGTSETAKMLSNVIRARGNNDV